MKTKIDQNIKKIIDELADMVAEDQKLRSIGLEDEETWKKVKEVDVQNTKKLKEIIAQIGWPTISKVGKEASHNAWIIAQHADREKDFQKLCLELMKKEPSIEVVQEDVAYLEDRLRINEGKQQLYGTQFFVDQQGKYGPRPIEDEQNLDKRRNAMGLPPMREYQDMMTKKYGKES